MELPYAFKDLVKTLRQEAKPGLEGALLRHAANSIEALVADFQRAEEEARKWKERAAKHGCDTERGDPDCG